MRILAVSHEFPPIGGGGANACLFLTKGLVERGHQVTLITANYHGMPEEEIINGVICLRIFFKKPCNRIGNIKNRSVTHYCSDAAVVIIFAAKSLIIINSFYRIGKFSAYFAVRTTEIKMPYR